MTQDRSLSRSSNQSSNQLSIVPQFDIATSMRRPTFSHSWESLLSLNHTLFGAVLCGIDGQRVEIQAKPMCPMRGAISWQRAVKIIGTARGAIRESVDRIAGAFATLEVPSPPVTISVNLAPAAISKEGTWLDLPLAIILLQAAGFLPVLSDELQSKYLKFGEIDIFGGVRRVPGALSLADVSRPGQTLIVPQENAMECSLIRYTLRHEGCEVLPVTNLREVIEYLIGQREIPNAMLLPQRYGKANQEPLDFGRINGQTKAKRAAEIAAAGGHNLLLIGPPGVGKNLIAKAMAGIMPELRRDEQVELTRIYSSCGELQGDGLAIRYRPFRSVHHSVTAPALIGGGTVPMPGEITLAHLGILFLDELPMFSHATLKALQEPLEDGEIAIARVQRTVCYPCRFTLVAAMNPCPCGKDDCICKRSEIERYQQRLSGPLLNRIDLKVDLDRPSIDEQFAPAEEGVSPKMRAKVETARQRQHERFEGLAIPFNAAIPGGHVLDYCLFTQAALKHFKQIVGSNNLNPRSKDRAAKVARTIADLEESDNVQPEHVQEAAEFITGGKLLISL